MGNTIFMAHIIHLTVSKQIIWFYRRKYIASIDNIIVITETFLTKINNICQNFTIESSTDYVNINQYIALKHSGDKIAH